MSASTPARCLLRRARFSSTLPQPAPQRCIHNTPRWRRHNDENPQKSRPNYPRPTELTTPAPQYLDRQGRVPSVTSSPESNFQPYTPEEVEFLRRKYTPAQWAAIEAGEAAVAPADLQNQGAMRQDPMTVQYLDDFASRHPILDKKVKPPISNADPSFRLKTDEELDEDLARWIDQLPEDADRVEWSKFEDNLRFTVGKEEAEREPVDYLAPELPKLTDPVVKRTARSADADDNNELNQHLAKLSQVTGLSMDYMKRLRIKNLVTHRVVNQTRLGKVQSQYYLTVAGNGRGLLGIGEGKSAEPEQARIQALLNAIRNMVPVPRYEDRTIYGDVRGKVAATEVLLYHRPPGFGIRCQDKIYEMCKCAGILDLAAKVTRSRNPMNTIKATLQALLSQRLPETVAKARGKKMVDVRKVYYSGLV